MLKRTLRILVISICALALLACTGCGALKTIAEGSMRISEGYEQKKSVLEQEQSVLEQEESELRQQESELEQQLEDSKTSTVLATITEFGQPYVGDVFSITATEIKAVQSPYAENGGIIVGVRLVVENVSDNESSFGAAYSNAYVDDVLAAETASHYFEEDLGALPTIAAGKRAEGYYCVEAKNGAKTIELYVPSDDYFRKNYVVFAFDIPAVEVMEP